MEANVHSIGLPGDFKAIEPIKVLQSQIVVETRVNDKLTLSSVRGSHGIYCSFILHVFLLVKIDEGNGTACIGYYILFYV